MKTLRFFTIVMLIVLVISTWAPAPAYAKQPDTVSSETIDLSADLAKTKLATVRVWNATKGTVYVNLSGPRTYRFVTSKQGFTIFDKVEPGNYNISITSSTCAGKLSFKKQVKGVTVLKAMCKKKNK